MSAPGGSAALPTAPATDAGVPPFVGDQALQQLNGWAGVVDNRLRDIDGRLAALGMVLDDTRGGTVAAATQLQADIQRVADAGIAALNQTITGLRAELAKHEQAHRQARSDETE